MSPRLAYAGCAFTLSAVTGVVDSLVIRRNSYTPHDTEHPFDCYTDDGKDYVGLMPRTADGRTCMRWPDTESYSATA